MVSDRDPYYYLRLNVTRGILEPRRKIAIGVSTGTLILHVAKRHRGKFWMIFILILVITREIWI